ncbi:MAG: hypothetical protein GY841_16810, partial [FCB group bacterium]|nr:hypothetical protein [FCB group bacterium]
INEALREEFSVKQSKEQGSSPSARAGTRKNNTSFYRFPDSRERHFAPSYNRPKVHPLGYCEPEPMDCSHAEGRPRQSRSSVSRLDKSKLRCRRCQKLGHFASDCRAPNPVARSGSAYANPKAKNGYSQ